VARSLARRGHAVTLFLPAYRDLAFPEGARRETVVPELSVPCAAGTGGAPEPASVIRVRLPGEAGAAPSPEILPVQHRGDRRWFERTRLWIDPATAPPHPHNPAGFAFF